MAEYFIVRNFIHQIVSHKVNSKKEKMLFCNSLYNFDKLSAKKNGYVVLPLAILHIAIKLMFYLYDMDLAFFTILKYLRSFCTKK